MSLSTIRRQAPPKAMAPTQYPLHVEILLIPASPSPCIPDTPELSLLHTTIAATLQSRATATTAELAIPPSLTSLTLPSTPHPLQIARITTTLSEDDACETQPSWRVKPVIYLYTHNTDTREPPEGACVACLPNSDYEYLWENLIFTQPLKSLILSYSTTRATYKLPSSGFILLHGPPGSGKSTLATALAQKLAVRRSQGYLIRVSHGALSKYFGESAHRIGGVFEYATGLSGVVMMVIDEIETFGMVRTESGSTSGDGIRVTNALLTGLDTVRNHANVVVVGTSNHLQGIDAAVVDRADLVLRVEGMGGSGRSGVLKRALRELVTRGVLKEFGKLDEICEMLEGVSARRIEGCVVVALGLVEKHSGIVEWPAFENALRKAARVVASGIA